MGKILLKPGARFSKDSKNFAPGKPYQNFKPYVFRAVLFTYSYYE